MENKLDGDCTRMLWAKLNKSWRQQQLYGHLPPMTETTKVGWTRHVRHCWRSRDELIRDVLLWTPWYGRAKAGWPTRTYIQQLCANMGCSPEDLLEGMDNWEGWQERVRYIRADGATWWWYLLWNHQYHLFLFFFFFFFFHVNFYTNANNFSHWSYVRFAVDYFQVNKKCLSNFFLYNFNPHVFSIPAYTFLESSIDD